MESKKVWGKMLARLGSAPSFLSLLYSPPRGEGALLRSCHCLMSVSILHSLLTHGHQDKGNWGKAPTNPLERGLSQLPRLSKQL